MGKAKAAQQPQSAHYTAEVKREKAVPWRNYLEIQALPGISNPTHVGKDTDLGKLKGAIADLFEEPKQCPIEHFVSTVDIVARVCYYLFLAENSTSIRPPKTPPPHAQAEGDSVCAKANIAICVMRCESSACVCVRLLPSGVAVRDITCRQLDPSKVEEPMVEDDQAAISSTEPSAKKRRTECVGRVGFVRGSTQFFTTKPGIYIIELTAELPYVSTMKQGVQFDFPKATQCNFTAVVPYTGIEVSMPQAVMKEQIEEDEENGKVTRIEAIVPPTDHIQVKWTKQARKTVVKEKKLDTSLDIPILKPVVVKEMLLTSGQDVIHSVGGGICQTTLYQHYTITNGSVNSFELRIDGDHGSAPHGSADIHKECRDTRPVRILAVDGNGLHRWEVEEDPEESRTQLLKLYMESAVEGTVHFTVQAELEMKSTSCVIVCPSFVAKGANRNKGNIAVQARTAVEVQEIEARHLSKVDVQEMPSKLRTTPSSVLHAYKYLTTSAGLVLEVTKHSDVEVLVATAEEGLYTITHTGEHLFYHMKLRVKNTQRQFARVNMPGGSTIWSCLLDNVAVKPAMDSGTETVLIPLKKCTTSPFFAELIFVKPFALETPLKVILPSVDIPISKLFVKMFMPHENKYGGWSGGEMKETNGWTTTCQSEGSLYSGGGGQNDEWQYNAAPGTNDVLSGIRPLTFSTAPLQTGRSFYLERLCMQSKAKITLECETKPKPAKKPRTLEEQMEWECAVM